MATPLQYSCLENSHGQRSLEGCSPWGLKESDTTEHGVFNSWAVPGDLNPHVSLSLLLAFFFLSESSFHSSLVLHFFLRR